MEYPINKREYMLARLAYCRAHPINGLYPKLVIVQPHDRRMFLVNPNHPTYRKHRPGSSHPRCVDVSPHYAIRWCKNPPDYDAPIDVIPDEPRHPRIEDFSSEDMEVDSQISTAPQAFSSAIQGVAAAAAVLPDDVIVDDVAPGDGSSSSLAAGISSQQESTLSPPNILQEYDNAMSDIDNLVNRLRSENNDATQPPSTHLRSENLDNAPQDNTEGHNTPAAGGSPVTINIPPVLPDKDVPSDSPPIKMPSLHIRPARPSEKPFSFEKVMRKIRPDKLVLEPPPYLSTAIEFIDNLPLFPSYFVFSTPLDKVYSYVTFFTSEYVKFVDNFSDLKKRSEYKEDWNFYARCTRAYSLLSQCYIYFLNKHAATVDQTNFESLESRYKYSSVREKLFERQYGDARNAHYTDLYNVLVRLVEKHGLN